jgi:hypothetical protein
MTVEAPQLVAIGLIHDAGSFVECARLVDQHLKGGVPTYPRFSSPIYFLLCHAIERALKAHLAASGVPTRTPRSKKLGHKIDVAFRYARRCFAFAPADDRFPELVNWLAPYHQVHIFRYRKTGRLNLPLASEAADIIQNTIAATIQEDANVGRAVRRGGEPLSQVKQQRGKGKKGLETLTRSGYARLTYRPPSPRKSDDVGVSVSLGFNHPVEGECNKIISEGLIVSQFSQTSAFACVVGVVIGGHGERSRWRLPGFARQPSQRPRVPKPKSDEARLPALTLTAEK